MGGLPAWEGGHPGRHAGWKPALLKEERDALHSIVICSSRRVLQKSGGEMSAQQSALGNLLADVAKAVRDMSDDEFEKLIKGELHPAISFKERGSSIKGRKPSPVLSEEQLRSIQKELDVARTREEGYRIVQEAFPMKEGLFAFARLLDLPVQKNDKAEKIRDKIVTSTVGRRLSSEAVRGGYSAK